MPCKKEVELPLMPAKKWVASSNTETRLLKHTAYIQSFYVATV